MYTADKNRYDNRMAYRRSGESGLLLPAISLGFWQNFGDSDNPDLYRPIVWHAFDNGITCFDLANNYGPPYGAAERNVGRILREDFLAHRDELIITTKAGYDMWPGPYGNMGSRKYLLASLDQSLKRLGLEYVDIFYSHRPDFDTPLEETMGALSHAVRSGKALYAGISNYPPDRATEAADLLRQMGTPCIVEQSRYSMFDREVESGVLAAVESSRMGFVAFSPLAQGLLTDRYLNGIPDGSRASRTRPQSARLKSRLTKEYITKVGLLNAIAVNRGQTLSQMAIAWLLRDSRVTSVVIGASRVEQLKTNLEALNNCTFTADELQQIDSITAQ